MDDAAKDTAQADIDLKHAEFITPVDRHSFKSNISDADHFAAMDIDDLLVEQVAAKAEHVIVAVIRDKLFVLQVDTVKGDGLNLIVTYGEPSPAAAKQVAIHANCVD